MFVSLNSPNSFHYALVGLFCCLLIHFNPDVVDDVAFSPPIPYLLLADERRDGLRPLLLSSDAGVADCLI